MKVNDRNIGPLRPTRPPTETGEKGAPATPRILPVDHRSDRVELSDAARGLAKRAIQVLQERAPQAHLVDQKPVELRSGERGATILPAEKQKDVLDLSNAARKLVKDAVQALPADAKDRLEQVRQRVIGGAYDIDHVVSEVARRILERGDL